MLTGNVEDGIGGNGAMPGGSSTRPLGLVAGTDGYLYGMHKNGGGTTPINSDGGLGWAFYRYHLESGSYEVLARNPDARASQRWHSLLTWGSDGRLYSSGPTGNGLAYWDSVTGWTDTGLVTPETIRAPWVEANGRFYTRSGNDNIVSVAKNGTDMVTYDITAYGRQPTPY